MLIRQLVYSLSSIVILVSAYESVQAGKDNGFDLRGALIPLEEIHHGGPDRDGIPSLSQPEFVFADEAEWVAPDARVLGIEKSGVSKAYPVSILNWHEIVNDHINGESLVVTYCPLCGSGIAFSAQLGKRTLNFGVSGLLYNSDVLLYDRETESLWSQLLRRAVSGPLKGSELQMLPLEHTTWQRWRRLHPNTLILSKATGHDRNYQTDPYAGYKDSSGTYFPVKQIDPRYHPKQQILGLEVEGHFKAYPFVELDRAGGEVIDSLAGQVYRVFYDRANRSAWVVDVTGNKIPAVSAFWFAWMAFHPESAVYLSPDHAQE